MHPIQKVAWFTLAVMGLTAGAYFALIPVIGPKAAQSAFALYALLAFGTRFYNPKKSKVVLDELDGQIATKANSAGFFVFWFYYVASSVSLPFYKYPVEYSDLRAEMNAEHWRGGCNPHPHLSKSPALWAGNFT